jgi:hypothetical protein
LEAVIPSSAELVERLRAHRASLQRLLGATSFRAMESELERFAFEAAAVVLEAATSAAPALASPGSGNSPFPTNGRWPWSKPAAAAISTPAW